jgi:hypothetical protein
MIDVVLISEDGLRLMTLPALTPIIRVPICRPLSTVYEPKKLATYVRSEYREFLLQDCHSYVELPAK